MQQTNFPTGIHKVSSYLFVTTERSVCTLHHCKSPKTRSDSAGNPEVSSYRRNAHRNQPSPILQPPLPPPSSEKRLKSRSNWFGLHSFFLLFPSSSPPPSRLCSRSLSGEARRTGMSMYKHGGEKTKPLQHSDVAPVLFFPFHCALHPHYSCRVYRNQRCDKTRNIQINKEQLTGA